MKNSGQKGKPYYSPTDLNNFVSCKYHIKSDLLKDEFKLKKKEKSANLVIEEKNSVIQFSTLDCNMFFQSFL